MDIVDDCTWLSEARNAIDKAGITPSPLFCYLNGRESDRISINGMKVAYEVAYDLGKHHVMIIKEEHEDMPDLPDMVNAFYLKMICEVGYWRRGAWTDLGVYAASSRWQIGVSEPNKPLVFAYTLRPWPDPKRDLRV
jgi:hypothetical protein